MNRRAELSLLTVAVGGFLAALWAAGPLVIDDAPLDLGSGIFMTPTGQIVVDGSRSPGPMRIPEEQEYFGVTDAAETETTLRKTAPVRVELTRAAP